MNSQLSPYLNFKDQTRTAMEFYQSIFGGKLEFHTFKEFNASQDPAEDNLIMHSMLTADAGFIFMAADTPKHMEFKPGFDMHMSLSGDDETTLTDWFNKLAEGGSIFQPLEKAEWGDAFGMCIDKFGKSWMVNISSKKGAVSATAGTGEQPS